MKKQRFLAVLGALLLSINCIVSSTITAYATSESIDDTVQDAIPDDVQQNIKDIYDSAMLDGAKIGNLIRHYCEIIGLWLSYEKWGDGQLFNLFNAYIQEKALIDTSETYEDYLRSHLSIQENESGELEYSADSTMINNIYNFSQELIEENSGFTLCKTADYRQLLNSYSNFFETKQQLDALRNYIAGSESSKVFVITNTSYNVTLEDGTTEKCYVFYEVDMSDKNFVFSKTKYQRYYTLLYSSETWLDVTEEAKYMCIKQDGTIFENETSTFGTLIFALYGLASNGGYYYYYHYPYETAPYVNGDIVNGYRIYGSVTIEEFALTSRDIVTYRIYDTLDDMKQYSVGNRPYYTTSDYYNYDSTVDNSTTITQTDIDNSTDYNTIYNYIINNNENPDSLTESELIAILDKYFSDLDLDSDSDNDDSGGSGSGSGSSGGSGLSGFLSGIGSIGDAILSILGKLLEYVGKALDLLSNTATKVIDLVPKNITNLLGGLFPFLPQEWLTAIELSLVLAVIIGIVGIFKK